MADELIDYFDEDANHLGAVTRSEAHKKGLWHNVFHCWVSGRDGRIWLQLRGHDKKPFPGTMVVSAVGHIKAGEDASSGIREIEEELGIKADAARLSPLFSNRHVISPGNGEIHRHFNLIYHLKTDATLDDVRMAPDEVDGVFTAGLSELFQLFRGRVPSITVCGIYRSGNGNYVRQKRTIRKEHFPPLAGEGYYETSWRRIANRYLGYAVTR